MLVCEKLILTVSILSKKVQKTLKVVSIKFLLTASNFITQKSALAPPPHLCYPSNQLKSRERLPFLQVSIYLNLFNLPGIGISKIYQVVSPELYRVENH